MVKEENISFILKLLLFFQTISIIVSQIPNIIKVGRKNFRYIHFTKDSSGNALFGTSAYPGTNERLFYGFNKSSEYFFNGTSFYTLFVKNKDNKKIGKYGGASSFLSLNGSTYLLSISNNDSYLEIYDFNNNKSFILDTETFFGNKHFSDIGSIIKDDDSYETENLYTFSFITKDQNKPNSRLILKNIFLNDNLTMGNMKDGFQLNNTYETNSTGKMVSCFLHNDWISLKKVCLYKNLQKELIILICDNYLNYLNETILDYAGKKEEDDNIFFKGIYYYDELDLFLYYKNSSGGNPILSIKKFRSEYNDDDFIYHYYLEDYGKFGYIEIDGKDFNSNYLLNDLQMARNNDIYFASSSLDREKLYLVKFSLNFTDMKMSIKYYTIKMFELYQYKFYNEIKLTNLENTIILGFNYCNKQKCEEESLHFTSVAKLNEEININFNILQNLYDTNENIDKGITIDFNPYKNSLFKLKINYIEFQNIYENLTLINPKNNSKVICGSLYDTTSFHLELPKNQAGIFSIFYIIYVSDIESDQNNEYIHKTETINGYERRNRLRHLSQKYFTYNINLDNELTESCDHLCSLCVDGKKYKCITCKFGFTFISNEKYCLNEEGTIETGEISDIYNILKLSMEEQNSQIIKKK